MFIPYLLLTKDGKIGPWNVAYVHNSILRIAWQFFTNGVSPGIGSHHFIEAQNSTGFDYPTFGLGSGQLEFSINFSVGFRHRFMIVRRHRLIGKPRAIPQKPKYRIARF
jgi:hypothetical protein